MSPKRNRRRSSLFATSLTKRDGILKRVLHASSFLTAFFIFRDHQPRQPMRFIDRRIIRSRCSTSDSSSVASSPSAEIFHFRAADPLLPNVLCMAARMSVIIVSRAPPLICEFKLVAPVTTIFIHRFVIIFNTREDSMIRSIFPCVRQNGQTSSSGGAIRHSVNLRPAVFASAESIRGLQSSQIQRVTNRPCRSPSADTACLMSAMPALSFPLFYAESPSMIRFHEWRYISHGV